MLPYKITLKKLTIAPNFAPLLQDSAVSIYANYVPKEYCVSKQPASITKSRHTKLKANLIKADVVIKQ